MYQIAFLMFSVRIIAGLLGYDLAPDEITEDSLPMLLMWLFFIVYDAWLFKKAIEIFK